MVRYHEKPPEGLSLYYITYIYYNYCMTALRNQRKVGFLFLLLHELHDVDLHPCRQDSGFHDDFLSGVSGEESIETACGRA